MVVVVVVLVVVERVKGREWRLNTHIPSHNNSTPC
jgi:hypothetical protein